MLILNPVPCVSRYEVTSSVSVHPRIVIKFHAILGGNSSSVSTTGWNRKWCRCESHTLVWNCMWQCNFHLKWCAHLPRHLIFTYDWKRFSSLHRSYSIWINLLNVAPLSDHGKYATAHTILSSLGKVCQKRCVGLSMSCLFRDICLRLPTGTKTSLSHNNSLNNGHFRKKQPFEVNNRSHLAARICGQHPPFISPSRSGV